MRVLIIGTGNMGRGIASPPTTEHSTGALATALFGATPGVVLAATPLGV